MSIDSLDAILFDVFGTVVDWRSGVIREGNRVRPDVDWASFADNWREEYQPSLDRVRQEDIPWRNLDELHRESLDRLLEERGTELAADEAHQLNQAWHRLDPWPDVIPGLIELRTAVLIAPLSNGHVRLLTNMAKRAGLPWDLILSSELAGHYKPDAEVYRCAVDLLDCQPAEVMMVAAHETDLEASKLLGLRTAYVHRPEEWGHEYVGKSMPESDAYDYVVEDLEALATQLATESIP